MDYLKTERFSKYKHSLNAGASKMQGAFLKIQALLKNTGASKIHVLLKMQELLKCRSF
jgi:hypothetical protein